MSQPGGCGGGGGGGDAGGGGGSCGASPGAAGGYVGDGGGGAGRLHSAQPPHFSNRHAFGNGVSPSPHQSRHTAGGNDGGGGVGAHALHVAAQRRRIRGFVHRSLRSLTEHARAASTLAQPSVSAGGAAGGVCSCSRWTKARHTQPHKRATRGLRHWPRCARRAQFGSASAQLARLLASMKACTARRPARRVTRAAVKGSP